MNVHTDRIDRTGFGAESAEATPEDVDVEPLGELLDVRIGRLAGGDVDAVAGANRLAEHASGAAHRAVLLDGEPVSSAPPAVDGPAHFGVLECLGGRILRSYPEGMQDVPPHIADKVEVRDPDALQDLDPVNLLRDRYVMGEGGDGFGHIIKYQNLGRTDLRIQVRGFPVRSAQSPSQLRRIAHCPHLHPQAPPV